MDQKKKILLMAGILGILLIGVAVIIFGKNLWGGKDKGNDDGSPTSASSSTSSPTSMPTGPSAAPTGAMPPTGGMGTPPAGMTGAPSGMPSSTPMPGGAGMPGMMAGMPGSAPMGMASPGNVAAVKRTAVLDPFKGGLPKIVKPKVRPIGGFNQIQRPPDPYVPVMPVPGINTQPNTGSTPGGSKKSDDFDFFGATPQPDQQVAKQPIGRSVGWMATEGQGHVVAYFELPNGTYAAVSVGSEIQGRVVKSIERDVIVLVDKATGAEERVKIQPTQR